MDVQGKLQSGEWELALSLISTASSKSLSLGKLSLESLSFSSSLGQSLSSSVEQALREMESLQQTPSVESLQRLLSQGNMQLLQQAAGGNLPHFGGSTQMLNGEAAACTTSESGSSWLSSLSSMLSIMASANSSDEVISFLTDAGLLDLQMDRPARFSENLEANEVLEGQQASSPPDSQPSLVQQISNRIDDILQQGQPAITEGTSGPAAYSDARLRAGQRQRQASEDASERAQTAPPPKFGFKRHAAQDSMRPPSADTVFPNKAPRLFSAPPEDLLARSEPLGARPPILAMHEVQSERRHGSESPVKRPRRARSTNVRLQSGVLGAEAGEATPSSRDAGGRDTSTPTSRSTVGLEQHEADPLQPSPSTDLQFPRKALRLFSAPRKEAIAAMYEDITGMRREEVPAKRLLKGAAKAAVSAAQSDVRSGQALPARSPARNNGSRGIATPVSSSREEKKHVSKSVYKGVSCHKYVIASSVVAVIGSYLYVMSSAISCHFY